MIVCSRDVCFFVKQKTAYEMRISDWSSDVCSSDLFLPPPPVVARPDPDYTSPRIEGLQKEAAAEIVTRLREGGYSASLIDGVTGSGKTEVYFEAIAATLRRGKQVLILLPAIALTASFLERLQARLDRKSVVQGKGGSCMLD